MDGVTIVMIGFEPIRLHNAFVTSTAENLIFSYTAPLYHIRYFFVLV